MEARPTSDDVVRLLAAQERLRVVAALVLGAATTDDVVAASTLPQRVVLEALGKLETGGLVTRSADGNWAFRNEVLAEARPAAPASEAFAGPGVSAATAAVLQRFFRDGRLLSIPTQHAKRLVVLEYLAQSFDVGVRYPETVVSERLAGVYDDYAALRRYLVDEGFLSREGGLYWRTGGPVDV